MMADFLSILEDISAQIMHCVCCHMHIVVMYSQRKEKKRSFLGSRRTSKKKEISRQNELAFAAKFLSVLW